MEDSFPNEALVIVFCNIFLRFSHVYIVLKAHNRCTNIEFKHFGEAENAVFSVHLRMQCILLTLWFHDLINY